MNYYNEIDPYCVQWLENLISEGLIPDGDVDDRPIQEVKGADLEGYRQCHFFAGIGGWPYALELAGWGADRPVWTGSCPCQSFSSATHGNPTAEDLWPEWRRLIREVRPDLLFGEQVASSKSWADSVFDALEEMGYTIGASVLPACSVGAEHIRPRLWFFGHADSHGESGLPVYAKAPGLPGDNGFSGGVGAKNGISPRMAQLRAYGNSIVPQVAAEFIGAYMEVKK